MNMLLDVAYAYEEGKALFEEIMGSEECQCFDIGEIYNSEEGIPANRIVSGDNLEYMKYLLVKKNMGGKLQLIYMDPPFFSNGKYQASLKIKSNILGTSPLIKIGAYEDCWNNSMKEYLKMLTVRFFMMKELLSDTGVLWVHLDWHASHYVKVILDQVFGEKNFVNEVVWTYKSGGANKRSFAKKHDTLLFYSKTKNYKFKPQPEKSYNRGLKPYRFKGVEEFQDEVGWYTIVNMKDVWSIDMVGRTSGERTGYATQKPEKLLERIIEACTDEGDLCADFFSGSGTLGAVCGKLDRTWILCDNGPAAEASQVYRLARNGQCFAVERCEKGTCSDSAEFIFDDDLIFIKYTMDFDKLDCTSKDVIEQYMINDSLSLVKFWAVGIDREDGISVIQEVHDQAETKIHIKNNTNHQNFRIVGYNIFGDRFTVGI